MDDLYDEYVYTPRDTHFVFVIKLILCLKVR